MSGDGGDVDKKEAFELYKKAAEQDYTHAQHNLGTCTVVIVFLLVIVVVIVAFVYIMLWFCLFGLV